MQCEMRQQIFTEEEIFTEGAMHDNEMTPEEQELHRYAEQLKEMAGQLQYVIVDRDRQAALKFADLADHYLTLYRRRLDSVGWLVDLMHPPTYEQYEAMVADGDAKRRRREADAEADT